MRAVTISEFGGPDALRIADVPEPEPSNGQVLVEVRAAAVNPVDLANLAGRVTSAVGGPAKPLPRTAGRDYSGVVVRGPEPWLGTAVWGSGGGLAVTADGTHAELVLVPANTLRHKPNSLSHPEAAAIGVSYTTAWLSLSERADVQAGETVLVVGAAGAVGRAASQIARWRGARVIGADLQLADDLDLDEQIDTSRHDLQASVLDRTRERGVDVVLDTVGGPVFAQSLGCVRHGGRAVVISSAGQPEVSFNLVDFYRHERTLLGVNTLDLTLEHAAQILAVLGVGVEAGALRPPAVRTFALDDAVAAYEAVAAGTAGEKVVIVPPERGAR